MKFVKWFDMNSLGLSYEREINITSVHGRNATLQCPHEKTASGSVSVSWTISRNYKKIVKSSFTDEEFIDEKHSVKKKNIFSSLEKYFVKLAYFYCVAWKRWFHVIFVENGELERSSIHGAQCGKVVKNTITTFTEKWNFFPSNQHKNEPFANFLYKTPLG